MKIRLISLSDAKVLSEFYLKNSEHLRDWEPLREDEFHSLASWSNRVSERVEEQAKGMSAYFIACSLDDDEVIATCSLTNIVRGPFQACNIGYAISLSYQGRGLMKRLCSHVINYAFNELGLNRIMANYMPSNDRSEALLNSLGFVREGLAERYLKINGVWEDHVLTALIKPDRM